MIIKFLKSYDIWEDDCTGWFDLYSIDDFQVYPKSEYDFDTVVPVQLVEKFEETLNGSKMDYENVILSLYYDLIITSNDCCTFDEFYQENAYNITYLEKRLKDKLNVTVEVL